MRRIASLAFLAVLASAGCGEITNEPTCVPTCEGRVCGDDGCGGSCGECAEGEGCVLGACVPGSACDDGVRNGAESDVDCGGGCAPCADGKACRAPGDCASGICEGQRCAAAASCSNGLKDGAETDVDCGGGCAPCADGKACVAPGDCASGVCEGQICVPPVACDNGRKDGVETDVDCGGDCPACAAGKACIDPGDCASGVCEGQRCAAAPGCGNGLKDGTETDIDCGGGCDACALGMACSQASDCASGVCEGLVCVPAVSCDNEVKDGTETDVDCGGGCPGCAVGEGCREDADCASQYCANGTCATPSCEDGVLNGGEAGIDCGGPCPERCPQGTTCSQGTDCASGVCLAGTCSAPRAESQLCSGNDAASSYLMDAWESEWNIFHGDHVPLGRHFDASHVSYHTALRFTNVQVPAGATITSAKLSFYPTNAVDSSNRLWINIYAERVADSAPFDPTNYETNRPDQRAKTSAFIDHWLVRCNASCTDITEYDCPQRKLDCWDPTVEFTVPKDLRTLVQEVVAQPGWAAGNAMTIFLINSATDQDGPSYQGYRTIVGYDPALGAQFSPRLVIDYELE